MNNEILYLEGSKNSEDKTYIAKVQDAKDFYVIVQKLDGINKVYLKSDEIKKIVDFYKENNN